MAQLWPPEEILFVFREQMSRLGMLQLVGLGIWVWIAVVQRLYRWVSDTLFWWLSETVRRDGKQQRMEVEEMSRDVDRKKEFGNQLSYEERAAVEEKAWEEYFAKPEAWWDNRLRKRNPRAPDFKHKVTHQALWIDLWYSPGRVKERFDIKA